MEFMKGRFNFKALVMGLIVVSSVFALSACGGDDDSDSSSGSGTSNSQNGNQGGGSNSSDNAAKLRCAP